MMLKVLSLLCLLALSHSRGSQVSGEEIDALIDQIFAPTPKPVDQPDGGKEENQHGDDLKCNTYKGEEGRCVPFYLCELDDAPNTDGAGLIDIASMDSPCASYVDVCCQLKSTLPSPTPVTTETDKA